MFCGRQPRLDLDRAPYVLYGLQMTQYPFSQHGLRISNSYIAPLVLFKMACNLNLVLRCVLIGPGTLGAGAKTRLETRIKNLYGTYCMCRLCQPQPHGAPGKYATYCIYRPAKYTRLDLIHAPHTVCMVLNVLA